MLNARRVQNSRHCITCLTTKSRDEMKDENRSRLHILMCAGQKPKRHGDDDNLCKKIPKSAYPKVLLHDVTKTLVILLYVMYVAVSVWGASVMDIGFSLEGVVQPNPAEMEYDQKEAELFNDSGPAVMFVVDEPVKYEEGNTQRKIANILMKARNDPLVTTERQVLWLDEYLHYLRNGSKFNLWDQSFYTILREEFLPKHPEYQNDIVFRSDGNAIQSSRFYVFSRNVRNSRDESALLINMRQVLHNTSLPVSVYSPDFLFYEHHVSILKTTILTVTVTIISMLLVALVFIPHPIAVMCVTISMTSVVLGFLGFLKFWKLSLSAMKTIQLLIAVGLCLNFTVHMSHSFMIATGKSRKERVSMALEKVGGMIMNEAISVFLSLLMLAFGSSLLYTSFFKCMVDVIALGLLHSMVLLPVLLTFIGPRRTNKPKVFIPLSPSCRTLDFSSVQYTMGSHDSKCPGREAAPVPNSDSETHKGVQEDPLTSQPTPASYGATGKKENIAVNPLQTLQEEGAVGGIVAEQCSSNYSSEQSGRTSFAETSFTPMLTTSRLPGIDEDAHVSPKV